MVARLAVPSGPLSLDDAVALERAARASVGARVVVLESDGPDFAPGLDWDPLDSGVDPAAAVAAIRCPTVAVLRGRVWSAGLELALACDLRVTAPCATFALPELREGRLPCWGATQRLPRIAGLPAAMLLLVGEELSADDPLAAPLAGVRGDDAEALIQTLLRGAPLALELGKEAVLRGSELPMRRGLELEGDLNHLLQSTADRAEGLDAFLTKREPQFEGR